MNTFSRIWWRRPCVPPAWRVAAATLAAFFVAAGTSKLLGIGGAPGVLGPLTPWIGTAEVIGGLMLLAPGLVSHAAVLLVPVVCLIALLGMRSAGLATALPAAAVLAAVVSLGYARRLGALLRARLERAIDRAIKLEMARTQGGHRESL